MKSRKFLIAALALTLTTAASAQRIKLVEGDLSALKGQTTILTEFTYDNMKVGKFDTEKEYLDKKTEEYNKKEAGRGDNWAKSWKEDRDNRYQPKFNELFTEASEMSLSKKAKYTLIFKTTRTEPGYNIVISRRNAEIDAEVWIVETENKDKVIAKLTVKNALGRTFGGYDYDTGLRLSEAYADAGKALGKFVRKN